MRLLIAALAFAVSFMGEAPLSAACIQGTLHETEASIVGAALTRMRRLGVVDINPVISGDFRMYIMTGSDVRLAVYQSGGLVKELRIALSEATAAETDRAITLAGFLMARYSGAPEAEMRDGLAAVFRRASIGQATSFKRGSAAAMLTRIDSTSFVIVVGELVCD